jgi:REP element-mobilizing transposase RayT
MARPLRIEYENAIWHVTSCGNEQKDIYRDDADREYFLLLLSQTVIRFGWHLMSWVLMSNHYHLLFQTPQTNLSKGMQWLNGRFAQYFNRRYNRRGHLFQGRFHGALVERESYLLNVARYVVLNPVRAGMVSHPAEWQWSSYRQTAGLEQPDSWLAIGDLLETFGGMNPNGCEEYVSFVNAADGQVSPWDSLTGQIYLGSSTWIDEIVARIASAPRSEEHPRVQVQPTRPVMEGVVAAVVQAFECTPEQLRSTSREYKVPKSVAAFIAFEDGLYRQSDIGATLGIRGRSTVSAVIRRCRETLKTDTAARALIDDCRRAAPRLPVRTKPAPRMPGVPEKP